MPLLIVGVGLLVGVALGALGGGGSILTVPALVYLVGQDPVTATTGSLIIVGTTALVGAVPHLRAGRVRVAQGVLFGVLGVGGAYLGSRLSVAVAPAILLASFAGLMLVVAALMARRLRRAGGTDADDSASQARGVTMISLRPVRCACRAMLVLVATATAVGMLTGFFGVGGGFAVVPALVLALRLPMPTAIGTSLVVITVNSASALVARLGQHADLDWGVIGTFTAAAVVGSLLGARLTARVSPWQLQLAFVVLLVAIALYTATRSVVSLV